MSEKVTYRKKLGTGRHSFKFQGQRYSLVPGDRIELPSSFDFGSFADQYDVVGGAKRKRRKSKKPAPPQKVLEIVKEGRKFNVVNPDNPDKPLNDKPITKKEAAKLIAVFDDKGNLEEMDWDQLVDVAANMGLEIPEEIETEEQLIQLIQETESARKG